MQIRWKDKDVLGLIPEEEEDLYALYKFLRPGDIVGSSTSRRIKGQESGKKSMRQQVYIEVSVEKVSFFGFSEALRISGPIVHASDPSVTLHSYHSIKVGLRQSVTLRMTASRNIQLLEDRSIGSSRGAVLVMLDDEQAQVYKVGTRACKLMVEINPGLSRKASSPDVYEEEVKEFFEDISSYLNDLRRQENVERIIIAGPGFMPENFLHHLKLHHSKLHALSQVVQTRSLGRSGVLEVLRTSLPESNAGKEALLLQRAMENLASGSNLTMYGLQHIREAIERGAVENLLILDSSLYESLEKREELESLMARARQFGSKVYVLSSLLPSGSDLAGLGGVLAMLRYAID